MKIEQHEARRALLQAACGSRGMVSRKSDEKRSRGTGARISERSAGSPRKSRRDWQIGYAPESGMHSGKWARDRGYDRASYCKRAGQDRGRSGRRHRSRNAEVYDRFRDRIMFPICNDVGEVIAFSGRVLQRRGGSREIFELAGDAAFSKGQCAFWSAQDQARFD